MYTIKEFCALVRISTRQYYRMRAAGDGPRVTRLGGRNLVSHEEMRRWLAAMANKLARIAWAVLSSGEGYRPLPSISAA